MNIFFHFLCVWYRRKHYQHFQQKIDYYWKCSIFNRLMRWRWLKLIQVFKHHFILMRWRWCRLNLMLNYLYLMRNWYKNLMRLNLMSKQVERLQMKRYLLLKRSRILMRLRLMMLSSRIRRLKLMRWRSKK